jgi:hypothetical protein
MISPFTTAANFTVLLRAVTPMFPGKNEICTASRSHEIVTAKSLFVIFGQFIFKQETLAVLIACSCME